MDKDKVSDVIFDAQEALRDGRQALRAAMTQLLGVGFDYDQSHVGRVIAEMEATEKRLRGAALEVYRED